MAPNGTQGPKASKADKKARILRPLGHMEKMQSAAHVNRFMCSTLITCRYTIPQSLIRLESSGSSFPPESLKITILDAISHTILEHPLLLVAQINEDSAQPSWVRIDNINLDHHVTWTTVGKDQDYAARFHESTIWNLDTWYTDVETIPGWRISILFQEGNENHMDLIFSWNHAHIDGMGGKIFHETLLRHLNSINSSNPPTRPPYLSTRPQVLEVPATLNLPPPQEKLAKHPISAKYSTTTLWKELKPPFIGKKDKSNAYWCPILHDDTYGTVYRSVIVGPDTTRNLLVACRKHKTTLTGLLHGLCLISLALQLEGKGESLASDTAFDQRRFLPSKPAAYPWYERHKTLSNYVSMLRHVHSAETVKDIRTKCRESKSQVDSLAAVEDIAWSAATRTRQEMQDRLDLGLKDDLTGLIKFIKDWRHQLKEIAKKPRGSSWAVTNVGAMDGGDGEWKITRALFQIPAEKTAAAFGLACMSVKGGDLNTVIQWQEGVLDDKMGDKLASDLQVWLGHLGRSTDANGQV